MKCHFAILWIHEVVWGSRILVWQCLVIMYSLTFNPYTLIIVTLFCYILVNGPENNKISLTGSALSGSIFALRYHWRGLWKRPENKKSSRKNFIREKNEESIAAFDLGHEWACRWHGWHFIGAPIKRTLTLIKSVLTPTSHGFFPTC